MEVLQQIAAVLFVLGLLGAALYWSRNRGFVSFGAKAIGRASSRRMKSLERLVLTPQHSLHLVKVGERVMLIAVSPGACSVVDGHDWDLTEDAGRLAR
jgi:flagellar biogenesis protein FliO